MILLSEYCVVLLLYNTLKIFSIKKCPVRTLNFPIKSSFLRDLNDLKYTGIVENVGTFIVLRRKTGISLGKITRTPYQLEAALYIRKQAEEKAVSQLRLYEKSLLEQEITIVDTRLSIQVDKTSCITKGTLTVEERCGEKRRVQKEEEALEK